MSSQGQSPLTYPFGMLTSLSNAIVNQPLSDYLVGELRSDHAGETGAVFIYKGIAFVAKLKKDPALIFFAGQHGHTESMHLSKIEEWLPISKRSLFLGVWRLAGWLTGALPALFGHRSVYATVVAVETFVDAHYQQQVDYLLANNAPAGLLELIIECQSDERNHRDEASELAGSSLPFLVLAWCWCVSKGSAAAVILARRL